MIFLLKVCLCSVIALILRHQIHLKNYKLIQVLQAQLELEVKEVKRS